VDAEGARALAERIAAGKPADDVHASKPAPPNDDRPSPPPTRSESTVEIVYLKAVKAPRGDVRIYVRGQDGALERRRRHRNT
jgi:hypothetical protein